MKTTLKVPNWQQVEVLKRQAHIKVHPESLVDFDHMISKLKIELQNKH